MAESALDRLKRLAAEKKAGGAQVTSAPVVNATTQPAPETEIVKEVVSDANVHDALAVTKSPSEGEEQNRSVSPEASSAEPEVTSVAICVNDLPTSESDIPVSNHPLAMQFAELESALLAQQPEFKTILRQIHRHLGQEPELVTQMTEEEIRTVVSGMIVFANAEIVAPAAAKTAKAKIAAAKKQVISADDL